MAIPLTVWHRFRNEDLELLVGKDLIIRKNGRHFFFIKEASLEKILSTVDETSLIIDLTDSRLNVEDALMIENDNPSSAT